MRKGLFRKYYMNKVNIIHYRTKYLYIDADIINLGKVYLQDDP